MKYLTDNKRYSKIISKSKEVDIMKDKRNSKNKKKDENKVKDKPTHKKVKIVGNQQFLNLSTNQVENFQVIQMQDADFNFHKIWIASIIQALDIVGNQKAKLLFWIVQHLDYNNKLIYTYRQIVKESGISYKTVSETMKALLDCNFLTKINSGAYLINPDCIFKGSHNNRMNILVQYSKAIESNKKLEEPKTESTTTTTETTITDDEIKQSA